MNNAKLILYVCYDRIKVLIRNPKTYIGLFIAIMVSLIPTYHLLNFANEINEPVNILEPFIIIGSIREYFAIIFLCLIFILSDAPYITNRTIYTIIRCKRRNWIYGCVLYIILITVLFYTIILMVTLIATTYNVFTVNVWSEPLYILSQLQPYSILLKFPIYFFYMDIVKLTSPASAMFYTFVLSVLYGISLSMLMYVINLIKNNFVGTIFTIGIHVFGYILLSDGYQMIIKYMPLTNALLSKHSNYWSSYSASMGNAIRIFLIMFLIEFIGLMFLLGTSDFLNYIGKRE